MQSLQSQPCSALCLRAHWQYLHSLLAVWRMKTHIIQGSWLLGWLRLPGKTEREVKEAEEVIQTRQQWGRPELDIQTGLHVASCARRPAWMYRKVINHKPFKWLQEIQSRWQQTTDSSAKLSHGAIIRAWSHHYLFFFLESVSSMNSNHALKNRLWI